MSMVPRRVRVARVHRPRLQPSPSCVSLVPYPLQPRRAQYERLGNCAETKPTNRRRTVVCNECHTQQRVHTFESL